MYSQFMMHGQKNIKLSLKSTFSVIEKYQSSWCHIAGYLTWRHRRFILQGVPAYRGES